MTDRTVLLWPDTHAPRHDKRAVALMLHVITRIQPDEVLLIGDFIDCKAPARWSKGRAEEYAADLPRELESGKRILSDLRSVHDGVLTYIIGNHEQRVNNYLHNYAPAFVGILPSLGELLDFDKYRVDFKDQPYKIAPGWVAIHGNKLSSVQSSAGQSAFKERQRHGASVIQGHSHRAALGSDTQGGKRFYWMECGHLIDVKQATYLPFKGVANWQQAFGLLHVDGKRIYPSLHYIENGATVVYGKKVTA